MMMINRQALSIIHSDFAESLLFRFVLFSNGISTFIGYPKPNSSAIRSGSEKVNLITPVKFELEVQHAWHYATKTLLYSTIGIIDNHFMFIYYHLKS